MADDGRHFDAIGILLVVLGVAYAAVAIYFGSNVAWSPHTDYYVQQIVASSGKYLAFGQTSAGDYLAVLKIAGKYAYADIRPDGIPRFSYYLPDMNLCAVLSYRGRTYFVAASGKDLYLISPHGGRITVRKYVFDLWSVSCPQNVAVLDRPVVYLSGSWLNHYGILRVDFSDMNSPEARVFYDVPHTHLLQTDDGVAFLNESGFFTVGVPRGRALSFSYAPVKLSPMAFRAGVFGVAGMDGAGVLAVHGDSVDGVVLKGLSPRGFAVTDYGTFISSGRSMYVVQGQDKNNLRVLASSFDFAPAGYASFPANYVIYGSYASDPAYIRGTVEFPHCPNNFHPVDANVVFVVAPFEPLSKVSGKLTPIELNKVVNISLQPVELHADFPCYSP